jgi:hypothetical protein
LEYDSFRIISDRNIFNPNRRAQNPSRVRDTGPATRVDSFALVGTMKYAKGSVAFFEGSRSEYRKALKPGDSIAGYKIAAIAPNTVSLAAATNQQELAVGKEMRREENGPWRVSDRTDNYSNDRRYRATRESTPSTTTATVAAAGDDAPSDGGPQVIMLGPDGEPLPLPQPDAGGAPSPSVTTTAPAASTGGGSASEVLRRLMQRREQELNR